MRILVLHDQPADFAQWLTQATPGHTVSWATGPDQVQSALELAQPQIVLSLKHSGFPGAAHRPIMGFPSVRWVHVGGSGTEHLGPWDPARLTVTNSVGVLAPFHAERALAGLLALSTGLLGQLKAQRAGRWQPTRFASLGGKTLLVVGVGCTGGELAVRAQALGMRVLGIRASGAPAAGVSETHTPEHLHALLPQADVLSLNVRATPQTRHLIGAAELAALPQGALLLNGARGSVLDTSALVAALRSGRLGGAWLDVFEAEPLQAGHALWEMENVLISAHCADQVMDYPLRFARCFVEKLGRFERGEGLGGVVGCGPS